MIKRKITVKTGSSLKYLQLWNGIFNLTDKEIEILDAFIDVQNITDEFIKPHINHFLKYR